MYRAEKLAAQPGVSTTVCSNSALEIATAALLNKGTAMTSMLDKKRNNAKLGWRSQSEEGQE